MNIIESKLHYGLGYKTRLPKGWVLKERVDTFAMGVDPDGNHYYLTNDKAFPLCRREDGRRYMDTENGVIELTMMRSRKKR